MAATKFTEAEREKLFALLETPFDPSAEDAMDQRTRIYGMNHRERPLEHSQSSGQKT